MTNLDLRLDGETIHVDKIAFFGFRMAFLFTKEYKEKPES